MNKEVSSKILDDAGEKIALLYCKWCPQDCRGLTNEERRGCLAADGFVESFEELSGITDIECPECGGSGSNYNDFSKCPKCDNGVIKEPWEVSVTLKNGELPGLPEVTTNTPAQQNNINYWRRTGHKDMLDAKYKQVVEKQKEESNGKSSSNH